MSDRPIGDHALLADGHSAALVDRCGSIEWLCLPRFDSPSLFGRLLDPDAGHFSIRPVGDFGATRRYLDDTLVLATTFRTARGEATLRDALALAEGARDHALGHGSPHLVLRELRCTRGRVEVDVEIAPRLEYGLVAPQLVRIDGGIRARGGPTTLVLSCPGALRIDGATARARVMLTEGDVLCFALAWSSSWGTWPPTLSPERIGARIDDTVAGWRSWQALHSGYDGPWRDRVRFSGRILQALQYVPSGAVVAAPTTSLPEVPGGQRNWDYRYAWVRDASLTLEALWVAACPDEAHRFFDFLATAGASAVHRGEPMPIVSGIRGERHLPESTLAHLAGWRDSRPVRVGNDAWRQHQLDVHGEVLAAAHRLADQLDGLDDGGRRFLVAQVDAAARDWCRADHGIWEVRGAPRHYTHSKLLCWVALDRGVQMAERLGAADRVNAWTAVRDEIRRAILAQGWSESAGAFVQSFGSTVLDASTLVIPIVGFLPGDDPRVLATLDAIEAHLTDARGLVYRYRTDDGLAGREGTFLLCTFWLVHALALAGRTARAREVFERACACSNDVGLFSEEVDPRNGELLGNFPQAFSHVGLVNAAWAIACAEGRSPA